MKNHKELVRVTARDSTSLEELAGSSSSIRAARGVAEPSIARKIINGEGVAYIPLNLLRLATDTQDGVEAITDNFILSDSILLPLLHQLLKDRITKSKKTI